MTDQYTDDGGAAYPVVGSHEDVHSAGLMKRDEFASDALAGLCANPGGPFQANVRGGWGYVNCTADSIAEVAYALADAMLRARKVAP